MKGDQSYGNRSHHYYFNFMQRLQQGFRNEPGRDSLVLQQGLPAPEVLPGLQEKAEKGA